LSFSDELLTHVREMRACAELLVRKLAGVDIARLKGLATDPPSCDLRPPDSSSA
jgi:hypothetical protein